MGKQDLESAEARQFQFIGSSHNPLARTLIGYFLCCDGYICGNVSKRLGL